MRILIVGPSPTRSKGGMATVIKDLLNDENLKSKVNLNLYVSYVDGGLIKRLLFSIYAFLIFCLTKNNYDIYHIHVASRGSTFRKGVYVKMVKKWKKKVILHIHGAQYMEFYQECSDSQKKRVLNILKSVDKVIVLSDDWKRKFETAFGLTNCLSLPNGIDTDQFSDAICDVEKHLNEFVVLGRLGTRKGTYDLIEAVERAIKTNNRIIVYLAGDGEIEKIKAIIHKRHLEKNIQITGWVDFEGKMELLKKSSTLILPSYNEGLPMSVLEGMAAGKAIISTTVGAIPEVIKADNGILIQPGDINALTNALIKCTTNEKLICSMGKRNIDKINNEFSMRIMHKKLLDIYNLVRKTK